MIHKAIVLAASKGLGSNGHDVPAPLIEVGGIPLIKRCLMALEQHGVDDVLMVVGYRGEEIRRWVTTDPEITANIAWIDHPDWELGDARSLIAARPHVTEPVLVLGTQLLFAPEILAPLLDSEEQGHGATLLVDRELSRIYDLAARLKVKTRGDRVLGLGADLPDYDAVALGLAVVTPEFLDSLEHNGSHGKSLGALLQRGVGQGQVRALDVNGSQWQAISSPETRLHAEWLLQAYGADLSGRSDATLPARTPPGDPQRTLSYIEGLLSEKNARHYVLFNPGPVLTSPRVKSALVHYDVCHRDSDYSEVMGRLQHKLRRICRAGADHDIVLLSGSGTAAMEATLASFIPGDGKLLVVSNGAFAERFIEIAGVHGIQTVHLRHEWGQLIDPGAVARALDRDPQIVATIICHHETSVGLLNPVQEVGRICRQRNRLFFVDAISSLGGEDLDVRRDLIDVLISSANKCLHAISGVSFVCVAQHVWPRVEQIQPRVYYLDLKRYLRFSKELAQTPFTPAVSIFFALDAALDELLQEGVRTRINHYRQINRRMRDALSQMGLEVFTDTGHESHTITTVRVPRYISFSELYEELKKRGYVVYACKEQMRERYFQIANMGELSDEMVQGFLDTLAHVLELARERFKQQRRSPLPAEDLLH
jgi:2-aminoethylphosphonate-pyruvate transaminase